MSDLRERAERWYRQRYGYAPEVDLSGSQDVDEFVTFASELLRERDAEIARLKGEVEKRDAEIEQSDVRYLHLRRQVEAGRAYRDDHTRHCLVGTGPGGEVIDERCADCRAWDAAEKGEGR
ncbi:hypothetical protein [Longimicrobium sp.]|uniref:hypothetical protein n=1 Tax=Longimicrobium sp. TaxID=2029185 RepID=UPI002E346E3C|nr:hypothetical protein [Longimicrobium sp.]HEX6038892.1 hypothetical protein [Longimicrobium sp.]